MMKMSASGRRFIEQWEESGKPLLTARWDALGHCWEIGFGHTTAAGLPRVYKGMTITPQQADDILEADLASVETDINHHIKVPLNQNQFDMLGSFDFNTGGLDRSSLLHAINNHLPITEGLFTAWSHAGGQFVRGLYNRRVAEAKVYNTPVAT